MTRGKLSKPIMLYLTEDMKIDIDTYSERMFMNKSQFIRNAIDSYIAGLTFGMDGSITPASSIAQDEGNVK